MASPKIMGRACQDIMKNKKGQGLDSKYVMIYVKAAVALVGNAYFVDSFGAQDGEPYKTNAGMPRKFLSNS